MTKPNISGAVSAGGISDFNRQKISPVISQIFCEAVKKAGIKPSDLKGIRTVVQDIADSFSSLFTDAEVHELIKHALMYESIAPIKHEVIEIQDGEYRLRDVESPILRVKETLDERFPISEIERYIPQKYRQNKLFTQKVYPKALENFKNLMLHWIETVLSRGVADFSAIESGIFKITLQISKLNTSHAFETRVETNNRKQLLEQTVKEISVDLFENGLKQSPKALKGKESKNAGRMRGPGKKGRRHGKMKEFRDRLMRGQTESALTKSARRSKPVKTSPPRASAAARAAAEAGRGGEIDAAAGKMREGAKRVKVPKALRGIK